MDPIKEPRPPNPKQGAIPERRGDFGNRFPSFPSPKDFTINLNSSKNEMLIKRVVHI